MNPNLIKNINFNKIKLNNLNINLNKKNFLLSYENKNFIIQTPNLNLNINIKEQNEYYELLLSFNEDKNNNKFMTFLSKLDNLILDKATKEKIKYKPILRNSNNIKYIKLKLLKYNLDNNLLKLIDENNKNLSINDLESDNKINLKFIIDINAIWIKNNLCGVYLKPLLIKKLSFRKFFSIYRR